MISNDPVPRSGDDTFDLVDDAVTALAERRGVWLGDDIVMALVASLVEQAERWLPQLVHDARANGHGWVEIARAAGHRRRRGPSAFRSRITDRRRGQVAL